MMRNAANYQKRKSIDPSEKSKKRAMEKQSANIRAETQTVTLYNNSTIITNNYPKESRNEKFASLIKSYYKDSVIEGTQDFVLQDYEQEASREFSDTSDSEAENFRPLITQQRAVPTKSPTTVTDNILNTGGTNLVHF
jgi:hypothetical protein